MKVLTLVKLIFCKFQYNFIRPCFLVYTAQSEWSFRHVFTQKKVANMNYYFMALIDDLEGVATLANFPSKDGQVS